MQPPAGLSPTHVFERTYQIEDREREEHLVSSTGETYRVDCDHELGFIDTVEVEDEVIRVVGWAVEPSEQPAETVAVFMDGRCLGYGSASWPRPDVAESLGTPSAQLSGFDFYLACDAPADAPGQLRVFVLSPDGRAADSAASALPELGRPSQSRPRPRAACRFCPTSRATICAHRATGLRTDSARAVGAAPCPLL